MVPSAQRALQNPGLFTSEHYKQAAIAVGAGIAIRLAISIPVRTNILIHDPDTCLPSRFRLLE